MVDWNSPAILMASNQVFTSIAHLSIGAYLWEAFASFGFEWSIITGRRAFKWPMLLYFYCKWMLVAAFVGMIIALNIHTPINCQALYNFNQFAGNSTLGAASTLLMLRSIAIWQRNRWIILFFVVVGGGLWGIQMHGVTTVRATWGHDMNTCNVDGITGIYLTLVYLYTMFTDLTVLIVTLAGLNWSPGKSGLWRMLWDQGIAFFLIAFIANLIPAVMLLINLNPVINIMFSIPTIAATATCACRCFVGLSEYARRGDEMSAALATNASGGWSHRIQGPMKGTKGTIQFKRQGTGEGGIDFSGYSPTAVNSGDRYYSASGREVGPTDTIDHIMRSMSVSGPPGQRFNGGRRESDIRLDDFAITPGGGDVSATSGSGSSVKYKERAGSDDTLSFAPLETGRTAVVPVTHYHQDIVTADDFDRPHRGTTTAVITVAAPVVRRTTSQQYHQTRSQSPSRQQQQQGGQTVMTETRRPSAPQIIIPSADASRRPSAVSIDLAQVSGRYGRAPRSPDENV